MAGRAVQYYDVAGYLVGRPAGAFTLFITVVSLVSTSEHIRFLSRHFTAFIHITCKALLESLGLPR